MCNRDLLISVVALALLLPSHAYGVFGDTDENDSVNAVDVQRVINVALGILEDADADLDLSGSTNAVDVQLVINAALGLPPPLNTTLPEDSDAGQAGVEVSESSLDTCKATIKCPEIAAQIVEYDGIQYHDLRFYRGGKTAAGNGCPEVPFIFCRFALPVGPTGEPATPIVEAAFHDVAWHGLIHAAPQQPYTPAQADLDDLEYDPDATPRSVVNQQAYAAKTAYPGEDDRVRTQVVQVGTLWICEVQLFPAQYIADRFALSLAKTIDLSIAFEGPAGVPNVLQQPTSIGYAGPGAELGEMPLENTLINRGLIRRLTETDLVIQLPPHDPQTYQDPYFTLLIITRGELASAARNLAQHKQDMGWRVYLLVLPDEYDTPEDIRAAITILDEDNVMPVHDNGDGTYSGPPWLSYIILFGDAEHICPFYDLDQAMLDVTAENSPLGVTATDHYYSTIRPALAIEATDYYPDVGVGRISVDDSTQGAYVVQKIVDYEQEHAPPPVDSQWRMAFMGYHQDNITVEGGLSGTLHFTNGSDEVEGTGTHFLGELPGTLRWVRANHPDYETWWQVETVDDDTHLHLVDSFDETSVTAPGQVGERDGREDIWCIQTMERVREFVLDLGFQVRRLYTRTDPAPYPLQFNDGRLLPPDIDFTGNTGTVIGEMQLGRNSILLHHDHGYPGGIAHPWLNRVEIPVFTDPATALYPLFFSINCSSGYFDNETDLLMHYDTLTTTPNTETAAGDESFCEALVRKWEGGAIAAIGGSRGTHFWRNDILIDGLFEALFPDYTDETAMGLPGVPIRQIGRIFLYGKYYMIPRLDCTWARHHYANCYTLFGDPTVSVWTP